MQEKPEFEIIVSTPPGLEDPSVAIAASRAGAIGLLDLEYSRDLQVAHAAIARLAQYAKCQCGIKLDTDEEDLFAALTHALPKQISFVILTFAEGDRLRRQVRNLHDEGLSVWLETTSLEQALVGQKFNVDGLIDKGYEAGGRVGEETSFILLQRMKARVSLPIWVQGGIGLHTAAACYVAGAAGILLDFQLALTRESALPEEAKATIARMDGSETICLGNELGEPVRVYSRPGLLAIEELNRVIQGNVQSPSSEADTRASWRHLIRSKVGWEDPCEHVWPLSQDAAFAKGLAERFITVGGVLEGIRQAVEGHVRTTQKLKPLNEGAPLARSHGTRYSIVQGPMTRVSDKAAFAAEVARGGALPFLALALMRAGEVKELLEETHQKLGDFPWGVGILGFVPLELRQEQLEIIQSCRPPFALIAGGRPDQALALERGGIPTYLHVPSPGLLKLFIENGARRFVFEGRECGGHVGPRSSFVLWNSMVDTLLESLPASKLADCQILFAGGIHDALSASSVATLAAPLAEVGAKIGVLLGTAYLFTAEAVATGAIMEGFQQEAIRCTRTVLLETGPGHSTRCAETPYAQVFERERQQLLAEGKSAEAIRAALEDLNLGRLRIASRGIRRAPPGSGAPFETLDENQQRTEGMFMIGQVASLRDSIVSLDELHRDVAGGATQRIDRLNVPTISRAARLKRKEQPADIAIVGMACLFPKAPDVHAYWWNILGKVDAIEEIPPSRWDWRIYYDADRKAPDKIYSKWGGFLDDVVFDPLRYGIPPNSISSIEPLQLLSLQVAHAALQDAGYADRPFDRKRASVILGVGGGLADLGNRYAVRSDLPSRIGGLPPEVFAGLPTWTEDSFPGLLLNVVAGRIANRLDFGGTNCTIDAACASSLGAIYLAMKELETGSSDFVLAGGADTMQNPFAYLCFSKTQALSPRGRCRSFDESADGIAISEGVGIVALKRLSDAEYDGDHIYAVLKSVGSSSDGHDKGLTAPRSEGQALALRRAYDKAGFSPATLGLIEAHGTGTVAGDLTEVEALTRVFETEGAHLRECAIGSVKSMIGHTKCAAGVAGLIKVALALHGKVLPPTLHVQQPNVKARFDHSPFHVNTEPRPWLPNRPGQPRRAGVSAFGFGGTNFHAVLQEYTASSNCTESTAPRHWPIELFAWAGDSVDNLLAAVSETERARGSLCDVAAATWGRTRERLQRNPSLPIRAVVVATSRKDLTGKLVRLPEIVLSGRSDNRAGIYFESRPLAQEGKVALLFPGQGSQKTYMLSELAIYFPEVRERFEIADRVLWDRLERRLSSFVFPHPAFTHEEKRTVEDALKQTNVAQPALGVTGLGCWRVLQSLGVRPDCLAGHSYGEYVALSAAGVFSEEDLYSISESRGRFMLEAGGSGAMASVTAREDQVAAAIQGLDEVWIANVNAPDQTVISGSQSAVDRAVQCLASHGFQAHILPVKCAFHSPLIASAGERVEQMVRSMSLRPLRVPVYSNRTAEPYPAGTAQIASLLGAHLKLPVRFADEIRAMHRDGARIFIEAGPRGVLTSLTSQILGGEPHVALCLVGKSGAELSDLHHAIAALFAHHVPVQLDRLFQGRHSSTAEPTPESHTMWLVNGGRAKPASEPEVITEPVRIQAPVTQVVAERGSTQAGEVERVMLRYQETMNRIVEAQQEIMLAYLRGGVVPMQKMSVASNVPQPVAVASETPPPVREEVAEAPTIDHIIKTLVNITSERTGYPPDILGLDQDIEADLGIDSIKRVEILGALLQAAVPAETHGMENLMGLNTLRRVAEAVAALLQPNVPQPVAVASETPPPVREEVAEAPTIDHIIKTLVNITSERTGYPPDILGLDQDIEADLGIDSIKRVEILGALLQAAVPAETHGMENLMGLNTLRRVAEAVAALLQPNVPQPVAVASETPPPVREEVAEAPTIDHIIKTLVNITSERTGYPPDILGLDQDIEADLGIDSIKRVEILGALLQAAVPAETHGMENLMGLNTLRRVAEAVAALLQPNVPPATPVEDLPRYVLTSVAAEALPVPERLPQDQAIVITDDGAGVAASLADHIRQLHGVPVIAGPRDVELVTTISRQYKSVGIVHLLPLKKRGPFGGVDLEGWRERCDENVTSLFQLAAAATSSSLRVLLAATKIGGQAEACPSQGGVAGVVKAIAAERPSVRARVVDFDEHASADSIAASILAELCADDTNIEVGYSNGRRRRVSMVASPLPVGTDPPAMEPGSVVLVTGGARGITAEVAIYLGRRYRPRLIIIGRTELAQIDASLVGIASREELRAALIERARRSGNGAVPAYVEAQVEEVLHSREIRTNLQRMVEAGADLDYRVADVRDAKAFSRLLDEVYESHGRIDHVIHGAGVIEDKRIEDKSAESFQRVFETKAISGFVLSRKLRPDSLKSVVLFSSIAARFGNAGQVDYAAANEVLNKLGAWMNAHWEARVTALNWGPWLRTGMVKPEIRRQFEARGIGLIDPAAGCRMVERELAGGCKTDVEVVLGPVPFEAPSEFPLIGGEKPRSGIGGTVTCDCRLLPNAQLLLNDHRLDGRPVLAAAAAAELMAELAQRCYPERHVTSVASLRVLKGIVVEGRDKSLRVILKPPMGMPSESGLLRADVEIRSADERDTVFYRATVCLADRPEDPDLMPQAFPRHLEFPLTPVEAYRDYLFHRGCMQSIMRFEAITREGIVAILDPRLPGPWVLDPVMLDSGPQLAIVWSRLYLDATVLPAAFREYRRFAVPDGSAVRCFLQVESRTTDASLHANVWFMRMDGTLLGMLEGLEATSAKTLNRLARSPAEAASKSRI